jgi:spermidine synthase
MASGWVGCYGKPMKPHIKLATTRTPDGGEMSLYQHDRDFSIKINGLELMTSRQHESEQELARLGCAHLVDHAAPCVLVGGLGMGYTLRQTLDMLGPLATVVVSELLEDVVRWNREFLAGLNAQPLDDPRTQIVSGDVFQLVAGSADRFDAILLDVDNGPVAMTDSGNQRLYSPAGMLACRRALRKRACLAIWSTEPSSTFEQLLLGCGFQVRRYRSKAYQQSSSRQLFIWVAAEDESILPPGGLNPGLPGRRAPGENRKTNR